MIIMRKENIGSQEGMERAFREYFISVKQDCDGTFNAMLDAELESCDYEKSSLIIRVMPKPWMANPNGVMHGGVSASLLDLTMGILSRYCSGGGMTPTTSMEVEYLRPAPINRTLFIRADVTKCGHGRSLCRVLGQMWAEGAEDKLLCTAVGTYFSAG